MSESIKILKNIIRIDWFLFVTVLQTEVPYPTPDWARVDPIPIEISQIFGSGVRFFCIRTSRVGSRADYN